MLLTKQEPLSNPIFLEATRNLIVRRLQAEARDPVLLAQRAGLEPDPWQADLLRSQSKQKILLCSRQAGKSTVSAILALHTALYSPGSLVLLLAPALRQSQELFRKVKDAHKALEPSTTLQPEQESALTIEFPNGSRIISLPGRDDAKVRGFSGVALLIVDEASRVPDPLYQSLRPMLAVSGGRIVLLSTPFGARGFFHQVWTEGGDEWARTKITADLCPRISPEWLAAERAAIGDWWYKQEYACEFVATLDQVFAYEDIARALLTDETPLFEVNHVA